MSDAPRLTGLRRRLADHHAAVDRFADEPLRDPRGGRTAAAQLIARQRELHARIDVEEQQGSLRHHRISAGRRLLVRLLPFLDGLVLWWFLLGVLNADPRRPDVVWVISGVLAVLASLAVAAWNGSTGEHLRRWKDDEGDLEWGAVDGVGRGLLVASAVMWTLLGILMYARVSDEVYQATGVAGTAAVFVAVALAAALVLVNAYVLVLAFADGSSSTAELDRLGRTLGPALRARQREWARADRTQARITARVDAHRHLRGRLPGGELRALPTQHGGADGADDAAGL